MALAIDTVDGQYLSNEVHHELFPKKSKVMLYLTLISHSKRRLTSCTLLVFQFYKWMCHVDCKAYIHAIITI